ncbi:hypothetical protein ACPCIZ_12780 [Streptomyces cellulosae]
MNTQPEAGRLAYIYALIDDEGRARYIGHTGRPLEGHLGRPSVHFRHRFLDADRRNPRLNAWLREYGATHGAKPRYIALEAVPYEQRFKAEAAWTHAFRWVYGEELLNINAGNQRARSATPSAAVA